MRALAALAVLLLAGGAAFWWLTEPDPLTAKELPEHVGDGANGERIFNLSGCASCHAAPGASGAALVVLAGGLSLATPLGAIVVPNISPDPNHGIGRWSDAEFVSALTRGVSPAGTHYTPAFPWTSYRHMALEEAVDLRAYLATLPPSANAPAAQGLPFPFSWRRPIGLWARFVQDPPAAPSADPGVVRGHHVVVALGHCAECHTPRTRLLTMDTARWLQGAPNPSGEGRVPSLAADADGLSEWAASDVAYLLESGFTPDFDSVGGEMGHVVRNFAASPDEDREAVALYLKALPPPP